MGYSTQTRSGYAGWRGGGEEDGEEGWERWMMGKRDGEEG